MCPHFVLTTPHAANKKGHATVSPSNRTNYLPTRSVAVDDSLHRLLQQQLIMSCLLAYQVGLSVRIMNK